MAAHPLFALIYPLRVIRKAAGSALSRRLGWRLLRIGLLVIVGLIGLAVMFENHFIYYPSKYPEGRWDLATHAVQTGSILSQIDDHVITTSDGVRIHGWLCSPAHSGSYGGSAVAFSPAYSTDSIALSHEPTILFFHGNAGNITDRYELIEELVQIPARVFIVDYRGYGKSEGSPSEQGIYKDAEAGWEFLTQDLGLEPRRIVLYGESLGGAAAIDLAARYSPGALILQSTFTSMSDMVSRVAPGFPRFLLRTRMNSIDKIGNVVCPTLFVHGSADELVPFEMSKRLYSASSASKEFCEIRGAGHNDVFLTGGKSYIDRLRAFITNACPR